MEAVIDTYSPDDLDRLSDTLNGLVNYRLLGLSEAQRLGELERIAIDVDAALCAILGGGDRSEKGNSFLNAVRDWIFSFPADQEADADREADAGGILLAIYIETTGELDRMGELLIS
jgi:hypothetical protein